MPNPKKDLLGMVFDLWTVIAPAPSDSSGARWWCRCECGEERSVRATDLRRGKSRSCGCTTGERHGLSYHPLYGLWSMMVNRCHRPTSAMYEYYGARGIRVCPRWRESLLVFAADMGPRPSDRHSVERKNNDEGYHPDNCYWATHSEQMRNRRNTVVVQIDGEDWYLPDLAEVVGISRSTLYKRYKNGLRGTELTAPRRKGKPKPNT